MSEGPADEPEDERCHARETVGDGSSPSACWVCMAKQYEVEDFVGPIVMVVK